MAIPDDIQRTASSDNSSADGGDDQQAAEQPDQEQLDQQQTQSTPEDIQRESPGTGSGQDGEPPQDPSTSGDPTSQSNQQQSAPEDIDRVAPGTGTGNDGSAADEIDGSSGNDSGESQTADDPPEDISRVAPGTGTGNDGSPNDGIDTSNGQDDGGDASERVPDDIQRESPGTDPGRTGPSVEDVREEQREREFFDENYASGPNTRGSNRLGDSRGLTSRGSPTDPLGGEGVEGGLGPVADQARAFETRVVENREQLDQGDVRVNYEEGQLTIERNRSQPEPRESEGAQPENRLNRGSGTRAQNEREAVRQQVREALEEQGADPGNFDIQVARDGDELEASAERQEQFGDWKVAVPSATENEGTAEQALENAAGSVFSPLGSATDDVAEGFGTVTGTSGTRVENVLGDAGDAFRGVVESNSDTGGEVVEDAIATSVAGPTVGRQTASDLADLGIELADEQTNIDVDQQVTEYTEGVFTGAASTANAPEAIVGAKEATEFVGYSASEIATGDGAELASDVVDRGTFVATQAAESAAENPSGTIGSVAGGVAAGAALGAGSSALSRSSRLSRIPSPVDDIKTAAARRVRSRTQVGDFLDDTRGQADFGTQTKQKTLQRGEEAETDTATTFEEMEEQGIVEVKNRDTTSELSDVEAEARERLPDADEYPSQSEFERELTQQMRRIEQRQRSDTDQDLETESETVAVSQQQTQATAAAGVAGTTAVEATKFAAGETATADTVATTVAGQQEATAAETVTETGTIAVTDVGTQTAVGDTTAITTGDTTGVTDTTTITDTVQTTDQTTDQVTVDTTLLDGDGSRQRRRDLDLDMDGEMDDVLLGGEPGGEEQQFTYEARDLL